jgi:hypothetical protein
MTTSTLTGAQERTIKKLKKKHGPIFVVGFEPDGVSLRIRLPGWEQPAERRERVVRQSGLVEEPV